MTLCSVLFAFLCFVLAIGCTPEPSGGKQPRQDRAYKTHSSEVETVQPILEETTESVLVE